MQVSIWQVTIHRADPWATNFFRQIMDQNL